MPIFRTDVLSSQHSVASHDTKAQDALKPGDGLLEVAHAELDPACSGHRSLLFLHICSLKGNHFLEIVQMLNHFLHGERVLHSFSPLGPIQRPYDKVVLAGDLKVRGCNIQCDLLFYLVLMSDQQVAGDAVAAHLA